MQRRVALILAGAGLMLAAIPAAAHHSFAAEYDANKLVTVSGTITKFDMISPHSWVYIEVKGADGKVVNWSFETASPVSLFRRGFRKDMLKPGTVVTMTGYRAKDGSNTANAHEVMLPDGKKIMLGSTENPG